MATAAIFTKQERHGLRMLRCIAGSLDHWQRRCTLLERQLARLSDDRRRGATMQALLEARQREQEAIRDLRDASVHISGLVVPAYE